jgi:predicted GIY-YIG superfamily endonuclease
MSAFASSGDDETDHFWYFLSVEGVYLLHFSQPVRHRRALGLHYTGWSSDVDRRIDRHRSGHGAAFTAAAARAGVEFELVRVWEGRDQGFERLVKRRARTMCPICSDLHIGSVSEQDLET